MRAQLFDDMVGGEGGGVVAGFVGGRGHALVVAKGAARGEEIAGVADFQGVFEAVGQHLAVEVPFAGEGGAVAGRLEGWDSSGAQGGRVPEMPPPGRPGNLSRRMGWA